MGRRSTAAVTGRRSRAAVTKGVHAQVNEKYAHGLQKKIKAAQEKAQEEDEMEEEEQTPEELLFFLHQQLNDGETVAAALRRMKADKVS